MLIKLNDYFQSDIKKPLYPLLHITQSLGEDESVHLRILFVDWSRQCRNIIAIFKCNVEKYIVTKKYAATKEKITSKNAISKSLYKKKKQTITSLDEEIDQ